MTDDLYRLDDLIGDLPVVGTQDSLQTHEEPVIDLLFVFLNGASKVWTLRPQQGEGYALTNQGDFDLVLDDGAELSTIYRASLAASTVRHRVHRFVDPPKRPITATTPESLGSFGHADPPDSSRA